MTPHSKGAIICKSRYGATRQYAEWLGDDLHLRIFSPEEIDPVQLAQYDHLLIGTSVYIGKMLIKDWLKRYASILGDKKLFLFVVCATPSSEKEKQDQIIRANVPEGLIDKGSIFFLPGRLNIRQLSWKDRLILRMGARLEKDQHKKAAMTRDIDAVKRENISGILNAVGDLAATTIVS